MVSGYDLIFCSIILCFSVSERINIVDLCLAIFTAIVALGCGDLVATDVLVEVLKERLIAHAVLDVYEVEPLPSDSPLWELDNVTLSPHFSSHSSRYVERSLEIFKPSLNKWLNGERDLENKMDILRGY